MCRQDFLEANYGTLFNKKVRNLFRTFLKIFWVYFAAGWAASG
jgi:hypothetical protein